MKSKWTVFKRRLLQYGSNRRQKIQASSLAPIAQSQTDERKPSNGRGPRGESPS